MNAKSIEYFLITAEELNFTRAAERLYISQQALSSHIKRLEDEYGVTLFARKPTTRLTEAGKQMVVYGQQILDAEKKMRAEFSDIDQNCLGSMKVGMSRLRGHVFFLRIWNHYHATHRNISVELINGNSEVLDQLLQAGKLDLYIGVDVPLSPNQNRIELTREKIHCCLSRVLLERYYPNDWQDHLAQLRNGADLQQLMELPLITLRKGNRLRSALDTYCAHGLNPRYIFESDQQDLLFHMARQGEGVVLLSPSILYLHKQELAEQKDFLYVFPLKNDIPENVLYLVYRTDYPVPRYVMEFVQTSCLVFRNYSRSMDLQF